MGGDGSEEVPVMGQEWGGHVAREDPVGQDGGKKVEEDFSGEVQVG